jgi:hypothetical protein
VTGPPGPCGCGCALTPSTSFGFDVVEFAHDVLRHPPDPWQRFALIHGGELTPLGLPRFRKVLVLAARQNGKTEIPVILSAYWQFVEEVPLILGTSTKVDYAKETLLKSIKVVRGAPDLDDLHAAMWTRMGSGEQQSETYAGSRFKIAASNEEGGRSLTVHRLILDELRQHHDYSAWNASVNAGNAVKDFQVWALTNAGDDRSIVLNDLRESAIEYIETGRGDPRFCLMEWSAPDNADPLDVHALAQANPNLGHRLDPDALLGDAARCVAKGGDALTGFKTEVMCIRVRLLNPAIDPDAWRDCLEIGDLAGVRSRVALCVDVAPDGQHVTLAAAAVLADGRVRVELVGDWSGSDAVEQFRAARPELLAAIKPRVFGWLPTGPAASLAPDLADASRPGLVVEEIRGDVAAVCMGLAEQVAARKLAHSDDPLLNAHVGAVEKRHRGDVWVFSRKGGGHCDAAYAAAGAIHLARTLPPALGKPRIITTD